MAVYKLRYSIKIHVLFMLVVLSLNSLGQKPLFIDYAADFIEADNLGNIYLVKNSEVLKFDKTAKLQYRYSNAMLGRIYSIDVTNPLRIMAFYRESNSLVFLNQQLAIINDVILLDDFSSSEPILATSSSEGGFWIFDQSSLTLLHFNNKNTLQKQSVNLTGYIHNEEPCHLSEQNQMLYLQTKRKIFIFDNYGNLLKTIPLQTSHKIKAVKNQLYYFNNNKLHCYNTLSFNDTTINTQAYDSLKNVLFNKSFLILHTNKGIAVQAKAYE